MLEIIFKEAHFLEIEPPVVARRLPPLASALASVLLDLPGFLFWGDCVCNICQPFALLVGWHTLEMSTRVHESQ